MKKYIVAVLVLIIVMLSASTFYFYNMYKDSQTFLVADYYRDLKVVNGARIGDEIFKQSNDKWWIKADAAIKYIDENMYYSGSGKRVYVSLEHMNLKLENRELTTYMNQNLDKLNLPVRIMDGIKYLSLDQLEKIYTIRHEFYENTGAHYMVTNAIELKQAVAQSNAPIYDGHEKLKLEVGSVTKNAVLTVVEEKEDVALIVSSLGEFGYVSKDILNKTETITIQNNPVRDQRNIEVSGKTRLVWEQIHNYSYFEGDMKYGPESGLDILSPTWFSLNVDGIVLNIADQAYVDAAHDKGLQVWALFSNSFNPEWTHEMLSDEKLRSKVIGQIISYSALYDLDGINIDFENVYLKDKDMFSEFVAELSEKLHIQGMIVSIDVTVPWGSEMYSLFADRIALADSVDYLMLMAYDEHWASIQSPGSVASRDWVDLGIEKSLELVPKEKLILGVPFYSRVWSQIGNGKVSSKSIGFAGQEKWLKENGLTPKFDEATGQNYAETVIDNVKKKLWIEDATSLSMRIKLAQKYDLPGIAGWSLLFTTEEVWKQIQNEYPNQQ